MKKSHNCLSNDKVCLIDNKMHMYMYQVISVADFQNSSYVSQILNV